MKALMRLFAMCACSVAINAAAESLPTFKLVLENHLFFPSRLEVPANTKFKLLIENRDNTAEEFDSFDLNREKVIFARHTSLIYVGPLETGNFEFFGEFNSSTARGVIVAVPPEQLKQAQEKAGAN